MEAPLTLTPEEYDMLRELINIGVGKAANGLSEMTDSRIQLAIPEIIIKSSQEIPTSLPETQVPFSAAHIAIKGDYSGNGVLLFSKENGKKLTNFLLNGDNTEEDISDTLKEITNITINAIVGSLCNTLNKKISFNIPTFISTPDELNKASLFPENGLCLLTSSLFKITDLEIKGNILLLFSKESVKELKNNLKFLTEIE